MNYKVMFLSLLLVILLLGVYAGYKIVSVDNGDYVPHTKEVSQVDTFNLKPYVNGISGDSILNKFPYANYIKYGNYDNVLMIKRDLSVLDTLFPNDKMNNQRIFSNTLTDSLLGEKSKIFINYSPDSLIYLLQWAERFKSYGEIDPEHEPLLASIYRYWMDFIVNSLRKYSKDKPNIKYDFKYRFLKTKCEEKQFSVSPKETSTEKVLYNLIGGHWSHLINASWSQATKLQVIIFSFFILLTLFSYLLFFKFIIQKIKK